MVRIANFSPVVSAARAYLAAGLSVLPARRDKKHPLLGSWKRFQTNLPSQEQLDEWLADPAEDVGICIIAGAVSGNLEAMDFDCRAEAFDVWAELVRARCPGLLERLVLERSQSSGKHVIYRLQTAAARSTKLAQKLIVLDDGQVVFHSDGTPRAEYAGKMYVPRKVNGQWRIEPCLIETKGEGGLFLCAPTQGYVLEQGDFEDIPVVSQHEHEVMLEAARSLDQSIKSLTPAVAATGAAGDRPGDDFNRRGDVRGVLSRHGWILVREGENEHWRRPGKDSGTSATLKDGVFYVFTSNSPPFDPDTAYSPFRVYAALDHKGDHSAAAASLRSQGYGGQSGQPAPAQQQVEVKYPKPLPLDDPQPPSMPGDLLPGWLGLMAEKVAEATETPLELSTLLCLSAMATAAQGRFSVRPESGYFEPVNIWTAPAMKSGQRKTAVHKMATAPLLEWEREKCREVARQQKGMESQVKTMQARVTRLRSKCAAEDDPAEQDRLQKEIEQIESSIPALPVSPRLFTQDVTPEHLGTMMSDHSERMAILSDEGGIFDILAGRYSSGIPNLDLLLQAHSGSPVRVDRGSRPPVVLDHPLLTMGLSPQPDVLRSLNNKPGFRGRGLLARFLYALPQSRMGYRDLEPRQVPLHIVERYAEGIRALLSTPLRYDNLKEQFFPHVLIFNEEGYAAWKEHQRRVETHLREGGRYSGMTDWAGKLPGAVARLAGLLHCAQFALGQVAPADSQIGLDIAQRAVQLGELLAEHALVVFDLMSDNGAVESARKVWRHIQTNGMKAFTFSEIWHPLRGSFKTSEEIEPAVEMLLDHYLILPVEDKPAGRAGRRGRRFTVNLLAAEGGGK